MCWWCCLRWLILWRAHVIILKVEWCGRHAIGMQVVEVRWRALLSIAILDYIINASICRESLYIIMCSLWTVRSLWKKKRPSALEFLSFCCSVSWITASRPVLAYSKGALSHSNYSSSWDSNPSQNHISDSPNKSIAPSPTSHSQTARPPSSSVNYSQIIWKS